MSYQIMRFELMKNNFKIKIDFLKSVMNHKLQKAIALKNEIEVLSKVKLSKEGKKDFKSKQSKMDILRQEVHILSLNLELFEKRKIVKFNPLDKSAQDKISSINSYIKGDKTYTISESDEKELEKIYREFERIFRKINQVIAIYAPLHTINTEMGFEFKGSEKNYTNFQINCLANRKEELFVMPLLKIQRLYLDKLKEYRKIVEKKTEKNEEISIDDFPQLNSLEISLLFMKTSFIYEETFLDEDFNAAVGDCAILG